MESLSITSTDKTPEMIDSTRCLVSTVYPSHILHNYLKQNSAHEKQQFSGAVLHAVSNEQPESVFLS